ncbi:MAG: hypothetical protein ACJAZ0_000566, partial [Halioglobus sp.]
MNEKIRVIAGSLAIAGLMMANPVSADVPLTLNAGVAQWVFDSDRGMSDT